MAGVFVPPGKQVFFDPTTGQPAAFGSVYLYVPGTLTAKLSWADEAQTVSNPNPILLDGAGSCTIWGASLYRQVFFNQAGVQIWDQVTGFIGGGGGGGGNVFGPGLSVIGHFAKWGDTGGTQLTDGGVLGALATKDTVNNGDWAGAALAVANGGTGATTPLGARAGIGVVIGTDVEAHTTNLSAFSGLVGAADELPYFTGVGVLSLASFTTYGRTLAGLADYTGVKVLESLEVAASDESTALTTGVGKATFWVPYNFTLTEVFTGNTTASSGAAVQTDVKQNGGTIFSTKPSIGSGQNTSLSGAGSVAAVLATTALSKGDKMSVDISVAGTGATGLKVVLIGHRT